MRLSSRPWVNNRILYLLFVTTIQTEVIFNCHLLLQAEDVLMKSMVSGAFALPAIMELFANITLTTARLQEEIHAKMVVYVSTVKTNTSVDVSLDLLDHFVK